MLQLTQIAVRAGVGQSHRSGLAGDPSDHTGGHCLPGSLRRQYHIVSSAESQETGRQTATNETPNNGPSEIVRMERRISTRSMVSRRDGQAPGE